MESEFSVHQFFTDGTSERVRHMVSAEDAVSAVHHYTRSVAVRMGMVDRVIIVDALDCTVLEWVHGKGLIFPPTDGVK